VGGSGDDRGSSIFLESGTEAYITGRTNSSNFPTLSAFQPTHGGSYDAFVTKLTASGLFRSYSSYLGGSNNDAGNGIYLYGSPYIAGYTQSIDFPTKAEYQSMLAGSKDAFVTHINYDGDQILQSTYLGGAGDDVATSIYVDDLYSAYITGYTSSANFPTAEAIQPLLGGAIDAFVTEFMEGDTFSMLQFSTYLGGTYDDFGEDIVSPGSFMPIYITGSTSSFDFPTYNPFFGSNQGNSDMFMTQLGYYGTPLLLSSFLGGENDDYGYSINMGNLSSTQIYLTGTTASDNFTTVNAIQSILSGIQDAVVMKLNIVTPTVTRTPTVSPTQTFTDTPYIFKSVFL